MAWWAVLDVSAWPERQPEQRGLRAKSWVSDPDGQLWLRKSVRASRPSEAAIEAFTLELARRCGIEVAYGRAAQWTTDQGTERGFVSRRFHDDSEEQWTGAELAPGFDRDSQASRVSATLERAYGSINALGIRSDDKRKLLECFTRMVLFDACIGNGDRHLGNWALLVSGGVHGSGDDVPVARFAPMFDTAGCLGAELLDRHALLQPAGSAEAVIAYARGCRSGFGDGVNRTGIFQHEVVEIARRWPEWPRVYEALFPRFVEVLSTEVDGLLTEISDDWWSESRRMFARRLLDVRVNMLKGAAP